MSAPVKLLGNPVSTCSRRVVCTLLEKEIPYELQVIDLAKGEHKR
jgi:glutathione S-transferase